MFLKFPHTPHLACLAGGQPRGDKVLSPDEAAEFLEGEIVVEEKVDGANVGFSLDEGVVVAQNRGEYLKPRAHPQFSTLWPWLARRQGALADMLGEDLILFGEWCYAVHSVRYESLPDWFLGFDVYDRCAERFWSVTRRNRLLERLGLCAVPELGRGHYVIDSLRTLISKEHSRLGLGAIEGLYLRRDSQGWLKRRAKLVRPEFVQAIGEHWSSRPIERNHILSHPIPRGGARA